MKNNFILIAVIVVLTSFVYFFNIHNKLFWDDEDWIVNNPYVHSLTFSNLKAIWTRDTLAGIGSSSNYYRPMLSMTFLANYLIGGAAPLGYHMVNNGLHILNAILIFYLVLQLFQSWRMAFLVALLFALHSLQTEAVTYIAGRGDPLSVFCMLLSLWGFLKYYYTRRRSWLALSLGAFVLAFLSREVATIFPAFIITTVIFLERTTFLKSLKRALIISMPYIILAGVYTILRLTVFNFKNTLNFYIQDNIYTQHVSYRIFTFFHALYTYIGLIFVPHNLHMERSLPVHTSLLQWPVWFVALGLLGLVVALIVLYRHERRLPSNNDISTFRVWFFGWSFFLIWLVPSSGIIPVNGLIYEHWLYFSLFGFFVLVAFYIDRLLIYFDERHDEVLKFLIFAGLGAYIIVLSWMTIGRNQLWGDAVAFYSDILRYEPSSVRIHNNLGNTYFNLGNKDAAAYEYEQAIKGEDIFPQPHFNLGAILAERGDTTDAIAQFQRAIQIDPTFYQSYENLAIIYARQNHFVEAQQLYEKLTQLRPTDPRVYYNLALIQLGQQHIADAMTTLQRGLPYAQNDPTALNAMTDLVKRLTRSVKK